MLISDKNIQVFDLDAIARGDCVRIKRSGESQHRTGFVVSTRENLIKTLCCNQQGNATSYVDIPVDEVVAGMWEIAWTRDFETINLEPEMPT
jgi:hypothetical protein